MRQIINSILDTDLYKFTQQQAALELYPDVNVEYRYKNRGNHRFTKEFLHELQKQVAHMWALKMSSDEALYLKKTCPYLQDWYIDYLFNYRFHFSQVDIGLDEENNLVININGPWHSTILWEVPLMAIISELYFKMIDTDWDHSQQLIKIRIEDKGWRLQKKNVIHADFGTRRRRSFDTHDTVVRGLKNMNGEKKKGCFIGTSNVFFAMKYDIKPIGTMAHEFIQATSALEGLRHANKFALNNWIDVYGGDLGIALTDTYTTDSFLKDFDMKMAKLYDGVRQDSGDPLKFTDKIVDHYKSMNIDPMSKTIIFSDGLNPQRAIEIKQFCENKIKCAFGIGTNFTNDFVNSPALNMVIKIWSVNNIPVVKLSDDPGKENGEQDAIDVANWMHNRHN